MYQNEMLDLQAWYAWLNKVANLFALSADINYATSDDVAVCGKAQWAYTRLTSSFKDNYRGVMATPNEVPASNSNFLGIDLGASFYSFDIDAGYITYGKKTKQACKPAKSRRTYHSRRRAA